jgi:DUF4097 and DUF4098 domain-containing protein YvlB
MKILTIRLKLNLAALFAIVSLTAAFGLAVEPDELREEFHHTYPLSANGRVSLRNVSGTVRITGWDRSEVRVDAVKRAARRERLAEAEIRVEPSADSIRIWTKYPDRITRDDKDRYDNAASVDYTLSVPRGARLDSVELVSGSLEITGVVGDVRASTVSGRFKATGLAGEAKLSTVSAPLEATFDRVVELKPITLNSVSGAIALTLPSDVQGQLRANTLSGPITNDFGLEAQRGDYIGHELYGQLGKGGAQIRLNTVSGRINIQRAADGKTQSPSTSLLAKRRTVDVADPVRVRQPTSEALLKAQNNVVQARAELRRVERDWNNTSQNRAMRALADAERNTAAARAELQRTQTGANSESQRAAGQAVAEAERKLAEARNELQRTHQAENTAKRQAFVDAQSKLTQAYNELNRIRQEEGEATRSARARELKESRDEARRIQMEMQSKIQREMKDKLRIQQNEIRKQAQEMANAAVSSSMASSGGLRFRSTEAKTFPVGAKPRITIGTFDGRITIHAWDKNEVSYTAKKGTWQENTLKGITLRAEQKGTDISIIANLEEAYVHRVAGVKSVNAYTSIEVYAPRNATIHASTGEGVITVEGVTGEIDLRNSAGSIVVSDSKGQLTVNAGNGQVRVSNFDGAVDARSGAGRVYLGGRFTKLSAQTDNQAIVLTLSRDSNAIVETNSESVTNEGVEASEETGPSQRPRRFKIGSGGPLFILRSGTGRVILRRTDSGPM